MENMSLLQFILVSFSEQVIFIFFRNFVNRQIPLF